MASLMEKVRREEEESLPLSCTELLRNFEENEGFPAGEKLRFSGIGNYDVCNFSGPFRMGSATVGAGRVEAREAREVPADPHIVFFEEKEGVWIPASDAPTDLPLEDGFATQIGGETIFGGVKIYPKLIAIDTWEVGYRTAFYRGRDFSSLRQFAIGPEGMKDTRVDDQLDVFTRPHGGNNEKGRIGYVKLRRLEDLGDEQIILGAKIIENQFAPKEWGGANDLHPLQDGTIGVIGHVAREDAQGKHYYAMSFEYDPKTHRASPIKIMATRKNFPPGDAKTSEHEDIVFPGRLVPDGHGAGMLYAGLSDAESGRIKVRDPFYGRRRAA